MKLYQYLDSNTSHLLDVLRDLISFETVAPPGNNYHQIVDYLIPIFEDLGFDTEKLVMPPEIFQQKCDIEGLVGDRVNFRARRYVGAERTVVIYTHLDVVPPGSGWSYDPFSLTIDNDRVYGRGTADSKGAVAGLIAALQAIKECDESYKYNLDVVLTTDEEVGGYSGLCYFTDQGLIEGDYMLCMDGFSDDVIIGCNGIITWQVTVRGKSAHSGASFLGTNAIEKALPVIEHLLRYKKDVESRRSSLQSSSELATLGIAHVRPMFNITIIRGGIKENVVPDRCVIRGDRRVIPDEGMEQAQKEMENLIKGLDLDLELKTWKGYPPMKIDPQHPWVSLVGEALEKARGRPSKLAGAQYSLDQSYVVEVTDIPSCVYGVGRQTDCYPHGADENVTLEDLSIYAKFLASLLTE